ncbi:MAG: hypothetical protein AAGG38_14810 [Planctomycetota bacterium]
MSQKLIQGHLNLVSYRKRLKELRGLLDQAMQSDRVENADIKSALTRLDVVLKRVRRQIRGDDANFLTPNSLGQIGSSFSQVQSAISSSATMNASAILTATDEVIEAYRALAHIPATPLQAEEAAGEYASQIEVLIAATESRLQEQADEITEADEALASYSAKLKELNAKIETQTTRLDEAITNGVAKMAKAATETKENAAAAELKRSTGWKEALEEFQSESEQLIVDLNENNVNAFAGWNERADDNLKQIEALKERASRIVELISDSGQAGHYKSVADNNLWRATMFTWIALILSAVPVVVFGFTWFTFETTDGTLTWSALSIRFAVGLAALVPATVAANEARRHKRIEDAARQRELEFAVISSYLEEIESEQQNEIRAELAKEYFGKPLLSEPKTIASKPDSVVSVKDLLSLLEKAIKNSGQP